MNLQQLRYLVATADHGTMTRAAVACHVAQPALSRAVRALERELDLSMFTRHGRSLHLTPEGRLVVDAARRVLGEVTALEALGRSGGSHRVLTVAATPTLQGDLGSGLLARYWRAHPEVPLRFVDCDSRQEVADAVAVGRADVGLSDLPVGPGLVVVPYEVRDVVVLAPADSVYPDPLPLAALGTLPLVLPTRGTPRRRQFDDLFADLGVSPRVVVESDERTAWTAAVVAGMACCIWYQARGTAAAELGARVLELDPPLERTIALVHREGEVPEAVSDLVAVARQETGTEPAPVSSPNHPGAARGSVPSPG